MRIKSRSNHYLVQKIQNLLKTLDFLSPLVTFMIRLCVAKIFWYSGLTKINDWSSTVYLFATEYKTPLLSPSVAAVLATCIELTCPLLLITGFGARLAAFLLLCMTATIEFTYMHYDEHYYWGLLLAVILFYGAGTLSFDHVVGLRFKKRR